MILLNNGEEVKDCLKKVEKPDSEKLFVALSPSAMYELEKRNIEYSILEDFYGPKEIYKLGINNFRKVETICELVDKYIHDSISAIADIGITPAMFNYIDLMHFYNSVTGRLFQFFKLIKSENPSIVFIYPSRSCFSPPNLQIMDSLCSMLLTLPGWPVQIRMLSPNYALNNNLSSLRKDKYEKLVKWLQRYPRLFDIIAHYHVHRWRGLSGLSSPHKGKRIQVMLFGQAFSWDYCREDLQSAGFDPIFYRIRDDLDYWMNLKPPRWLDMGALEEAWKELRENEKFRRFFLWNGINFFPVMEEYLRFMVTRLTPACVNAYEKTYEILQKKNIKVFLSSGFDSCTGHSAARAARNLGIPVVVWQHGPIVAQFRWLLYNDFRGPPAYPPASYVNLMSNDFLFVFGEGVAKNLEKLAKPFGTKLVVIGSAALESVPFERVPSKLKKFKDQSSGKLALWVLPPFYDNVLPITGYPPISDNINWRVQNTILSVFEKYSNWQVIVKLKQPKTKIHPVNLYIAERGLKNFKVLGKEFSLRHLFQIVDLIVLMYPWMVLLESLLLYQF